MNDVDSGNRHSGNATARDAKSFAVELYDSCVFDQLLGDTLRPGGLELTARLAEVAGIDRNQVVLEVGCGKGTTTAFLAGKYGCRVTGIDLSEKMIAHCRSEHGRLLSDNAVSFVLGDGENLPFGDASFDTVVSECSFSLLPDKKLAAKHIWRVLKPGGNLVMTDIVIRGKVARNLPGRIGFPCCFTGAWQLQKYIRLFEQVGFWPYHVEDHSDELMEIGYRLAMTFGGVDDFAKMLPDGPCKIKGTGERPGNTMSFEEFLKISRPGYALIAMTKI